MNNATIKQAKQDGTVERQDPITEEWLPVPCFCPRPGYSVNDVVKALGLRILGRKEVGKVVAVIEDGFGGADCVSK